MCIIHVAARDAILGPEPRPMMFEGEESCTCEQRNLLLARWEWSRGQVPYLHIICCFSYFFCFWYNGTPR
jgi:hypothetical protein